MKIVTKTLTRFLITFMAIMVLSGCVVVTVVETAVDVTTAVVGGAVDVVDAITPDIISDDDDDDDDEDNDDEDEDEDEE